MRTRADVSACLHPFVRTSASCDCARLVLLPAVVAAAALHAPQPRWRCRVACVGRGPSRRPHAVRSVVARDEEVRPRGGPAAGTPTFAAMAIANRVWQGKTGNGGSDHVKRAAGRARLQADPQGAAPPGTETVSLHQRSLVAMHPLVPDPVSRVRIALFAGDRGRPRTAPRAAGALTPTRSRWQWRASPVTSRPQSRPWSRAPGRTAAAPAALEASGTLQVSAPRCTGHRRPSELSDWSIHWRASAACLATPLRSVLDLVAAEFGPLTVNSTCRSRAHNARVGGASRSYHLTGDAVDFRVRSDFKEVLAFLGRLRTVGGLTHYGSGVFHIDTGPRRTWGPRSWGRHRARRSRRA